MTGRRERITMLSDLQWPAPSMPGCSEGAVKVTGAQIAVKSGGTWFAPSQQHLGNDRGRWKIQRSADYLNVHMLLACRSEGPFLDIGTPESYAAAEQFFASAI